MADDLDEEQIPGAVEVDFDGADVVALTDRGDHGVQMIGNVVLSVLPSDPGGDTEFSRCSIQRHDSPSPPHIQ
jgi:hypothetical protein